MAPGNDLQRYSPDSPNSQHGQSHTPKWGWGIKTTEWNPYHQPTYNSQDSQATRAKTNTGAIQRQGSESKQHGSHKGSPIDRNGSAITNADNTVEAVLHRLDQLSEREVRAYNEQVKARVEAQHTLRDVLNIQQKKHEDEVKALQVKMGRAERERDMIAQQMKTLQDEVLSLQKQVHRSTYDRPERPQQPTAVVSQNTFTPHTADGVSGQDLIHDVEQLNNEIYQLAALITEELEKTPRWRNSEILARDTDALRKFFGERIANYVIRAKAKGQHPWLMHAVQTCMIASCRTVLMKLTLLPSEVIGEAFEGVYEKIRSSEGQGVSGQWRSLIRRHGPDITEDEVCSIIERHIRKLCRILGLSTRDSIAVHSDSFKPIASQTLQLHKTIYGDILSGDIKIIFPEPGTLFDPETMDDNDEKRIGVKLLSGKPIRCATDMGLMKSVVDKVFSDGKYSFHEQTTTILKAKVFLDS